MVGIANRLLLKYSHVWLSPLNQKQHKAERELQQKQKKSVLLIQWYVTKICCVNRP